MCNSNAPLFDVQTLGLEAPFMDFFDLSPESAVGKVRQILLAAGFCEEVFTRSLRWDEFVFGVLVHPKEPERYFRRHYPNMQLAMNMLSMFVTTD